jgi:hypothetical protein
MYRSSQHHIIQDLPTLSDKTSFISIHHYLLSYRTISPEARPSLKRSYLSIVLNRDAVIARISFLKRSLFEIN